jgi:hypothetical protein
MGAARRPGLEDEAKDGRVNCEKKQGIDARPEIAEEAADGAPQPGASGHDRRWRRSDQ